MSTVEQKIKRCSRWTLILCVVGLLISIYSHYVKSKKQENNSYEALCDINEDISCTKAVNSVYGKGFGLLSYVIPENSPLKSLNLPNSVFGYVFYVFHIILEYKNTVRAAKIQIAFSVMSNISTIYLAYVLIFKLKTFCAICVSIYVINALLLHFNYSKYLLLKAAAQPKRKRR